MLLKLNRVVRYLKDLAISKYPIFELEPYNPEKDGTIIVPVEIEGYSEKERYWINEPFSFIQILYNDQQKEFLYVTAEPFLTPYEKLLLETVHENILYLLTPEDLQIHTKEEVLRKKVLELLHVYSKDLENVTIHKILYYIFKNYIGYGKIDCLMNDDNIEDISCDGIDVPIFLYHVQYQNIKTNISFEEIELNSIIIKLAQLCGKHISIGEPLLNANLPDGSRLNTSLGKEITFRGGSFTIRKFRKEPFTPISLIKHGTYSSEILAYLWLAIENNKSLIFAGGTASGKTSSLNAISIFIPPLSKVVSIEDTHELSLYNENWIGSVTRESFTTLSTRDIDMYELLRQALRQRPEYIIVGEVRGKEALTLFQAMSTGHTTYSTIHAGSIFSVISRLESEPINVPRVMLQALDIVCIQTMVYLNGMRVRRVKEVVEIAGVDPESNDLKINNLFSWDPVNDTFTLEGDSHVLSDIMSAHGWNDEKLNSELQNRQKILENLVKQDITKYQDVASIIMAYYLEPEETLKKLV